MGAGLSSLAERAREAGAEVVRHETNRGKGRALATGLGWAGENGFDAAITLDGDGQHDPAEIGKLLVAAGTRAARTNAGRQGAGRRAGALSPRADIVVGCRRFRAGFMPAARRFTNRGMSWILSSIAGRKLSDTQSGYRLIRVDAWRRLGLSTSHFDAESEMLVTACRLGMRVAEVPVRTIYGDEKSSIHPVHDAVRWVRLIWRLAWGSARTGRADDQERPGPPGVVRTTRNGLAHQARRAGEGGA